MLRRLISAPSTGLALWVATASVLHGADFIKADNATALNAGGSWVGAAVPGANDVAVWNSTVTGANTVALGANLTLSGLKIVDPAGAVTLSSGNTLTLLGGGIDMSAATQDLTINAGVALGTTANGSFAQTWNVASGRTLTVAAVPTRNGNAANLSVGGVINVAGSGSVKIGTTASTLLVDGGGNPFVTLNGDDWAATDATGKVIAATYTDFAAAGALSGSTNYNVTGSGAYTMNGATPASVRFANTGGAVTLTNSGTSTLRGVLMTSGAKDVTINGGFIRPNRVNTGGATFSFIQNSTAGTLLVSSTFATASSTTPVSITKSGVGKMIVTGDIGTNGSTIGGQIFVHEGTFQLGNGSTAGTLTATGAIFNNGTFAVNRSDAVTLTNAISGSGSVNQEGAGTLTLSGANTYTGTTNLNAGTLAFNAANNLGSGGAITFNGGTLLYGTGHTTDISGRAVTLAAGGGKIDTNGNNVTFASGIGNGGSGGLTKLGTGTLELANAGNYGGGTTVTTGTLKVSNTTGSATGAGNISIGAAGTLAGNGIVSGTVTTGLGSTIAPGASVGTLTVGGLSLASGSVLNYEFNGSGNDKTVVTGSNGLTINGGGFNLYQENTTTAFSTVGTYNLIQFAGSVQGTGVSALGVLNPQPGRNYAFGTATNQVTLDISLSGVISKWNVPTGGSWTTAGNWDAAVPNGVGETANFTTALGAASTVTLDGNKKVGGASFDSANAYTLDSGTGGTLSLDNGANQANLIVTSGSHAVTAPVSLDSNTVVAIASGSQLTLAGGVAGTGSFTKSGPGTTNLTGPASYTGETKVMGGTLAFSSGSLGAAAVTLDGGTLRYNSGNTQDISGQTVTLGLQGGKVDTNGNDVSYASAIGNSGSGAFTKAGAGTLTLAAGSTHGGPTSVTGGSLVIAGPSSSSALLLDGAGVLAAVSADSGLGVASAPIVFTPGAGNSATLRFDAPVSVGAGHSLNLTSGTAILDTNGNAVTVNGGLVGAGQLRKAGAGTLTLAGAGSQTGTTVDAGTLAIANSAALGSGTVVLNGTSTLDLGARSLGNALAVNGTNSLLSGDNGGVSAVNAVTGSGTLNVTISGANVDLRGDMTNFTGTVAITSATGALRLNGTAGSASATFDLGTGSAFVRNAATGISLGVLSGAAGSTLSGSGGGATQALTYTVGGKGVSTTFAGAITNGAGAVSLVKAGNGTQTLSGANTYSGSTTVNAGTLLVTGTHAASATGTAAYTVNSGGTLGGTGVITTGNANVTFNTGARLAPGTSPGTLTFALGTGTLSLTNAVAPLTSASLAFELDSPGSSDSIVLTSGTLDIGSGVLDWLDFDFSPLGGFGPGTYVLFDTPGAITGSLGSNLTGTIGGLPGTLALSGDGQDLLLTVVPEPATGLLGATAAVGLARRRRRRA